MTTDWGFENEFARLAWNQFWQVSLLAIVIGIVVSLLCKTRPHAAYFLWLLVIVKCVTPPVWCSPMGVFSWTNVQWEQTSQLPLPETTAKPSSQPTVRLDRKSTHQPADGISKQSKGPFPRQPSEPPADATPIVEPPLQSIAWWNRSSGIPILGLIWLIGTTTFSLIVFARVCLYSLMLRRSCSSPDEQTSDLFQQLAQRLGLRRRVRLLVSEGAAGPAVFGAFRPTVLIPRKLLAVLSADHIRSVLAHELVHVRRGDTVIGILQLGAQVIWWFHPLVWWANRAMTRERERSCDEEVLGDLDCQPSVYAQSLLEVLKRKRQLKPLLGFPGVRALEITTKRLEHIMKRDSKFHRRAPRICWLVLLLGGLIVLPGAGITLGALAGQKIQKAKSTTPRSKKQSQQPKAGNPKPRAKKAAHTTKVLRLKNMLASDMARVLREVYRDLTKLNKKTQRPILSIGVEAPTNSLLCSGPPRVVKQIEALVGRLDVKTAPAAQKRKGNDVRRRLDRLDLLLAKLTEEVRDLKRSVSAATQLAAPRSAATTTLDLRKFEIRLDNARRKLKRSERLHASGSLSETQLQSDRTAMLLATNDLQRAKVAHAEQGATIKLDILTAQANLAIAKEDLKRVEGLFKRGFATKSVLTQAKLAIDKAEINLIRSLRRKEHYRLEGRKSRSKSKPAKKSRP